LNSKSILVIGLTIIVIISAVGYWGYRRASTPPTDNPVTPVTVTVTRGDVQQTVTAPGQLVGRKEVLSGFAVAGRVATVNVQPGSKVQAGQVLAQLDQTRLRQALAESQLNLEQAQATHTYELAQAQLNLQIAEARLKQSQTHLPTLTERQAELGAAQAELQQLLHGLSDDELTIAAVELLQSRNELQQAQWAYDEVAYAADIGARPEAAALQAATLDYESKRAAYNLATHGPNEADIAQARANVAQAQAQLEAGQSDLAANQQQIAILETEVAQARLTLDQLQRGIDPHLVKAVEQAEEDLAAATLVAPFDGVVLDLFVKPGQFVNTESPVLLLADPTAVEVQVKVIEEDLPLVQLEQPVEIFFDAHPADALPGMVTRLVPQRIQNEERPLYHVYIAPQQLPSTVVSGMTADTAIIVARRTDVLRLPRTLVQANSQGTAKVQLWRNGKTEERTVQVGLRGDIYVEIMDGLPEGAQVVGE
jgi:HlyD family secretion protein